MPRDIKKDLNPSYHLEITEHNHRDIQDFATQQRKVSNEERINAQNTVNKAKDIINNSIDSKNVTDTIRIELLPYMLSTDREEKSTYYHLNDLENALFDNKNISLIWGQISAEANYNKILRQSLDTIAVKMKIL